MVISQEQMQPKKVREQLERVVTSAIFQKSERLQRFLRFVVEETLADRTKDLKGFTIALEVFDKDESFDPQHDSIVRVEAGRLRLMLEQYYHNGGQHDPLQILIPKGSYVPSFRIRNSVDVYPEASRIFSHTRSEHPRLVVLSLLNLSENPEQAYFAASLTGEFVTALTRSSGITVIGPLHRGNFEQGGTDLQYIGQKYGAQFFLDGSVCWYDGQLRIMTKLLDTQTNANLWAKSYTYSLKSDSWLTIIDEVSNRVVATLTDSFGIIPRTLTTEKSLYRPLDDVSVHDATLRFHHATLCQSPETIRAARVALEHVLELSPDHVDVLEMLADIYIRTFLLGFDEHAPLDRAERQVRRALALDSQHQGAHFTLGFLYFSKRERNQCLKELRIALSLNPNNANILGAVGFMFVALGEYQEGVELVQKAMFLNPLYPGWYHGAISLSHYCQGDYEAALEEALRFNIPEHFMDPVLRAATQGQLGHHVEAGASLQELYTLFPDFTHRGPELLCRRAFSDEHVEMLWDGLRKAGLRDQEGRTHFSQ